MNKVNVSARCPIRTTLDLLGGKWKLLIIFQLFQQPLRLSELRKSMPDISEKMLIQELKTLAESGLVHRENFGEVPPRVEYALTAKGKAAMPVIESIRSFGVGYLDELTGA